MADILISIAAKIAEYPVAPILRQFGYLINFNKNVSNLNQQAETLKDLKSQTIKKVEHARKNGEEIDRQVEWWLGRVDEIIAEVEKIEDQSKTNKNCFAGPFPNCIYRYRVSRKSTKKLTSIQELEKYKFDRISYSPKLPGIDYFSSKDIILFDSTKSTIDQILILLGEEETNLVVLHGTRGVGKTTLAKELGKKAKAENLFDEVAIAFVSKTCDLETIQGQLADMLGLKLEEQSTSGRARRLNLRLKNEKILIILDGVLNNNLKLEDIGIPTATDHKGCKILVTTQNENIWRAFGDGTEKVAHNPLSEEESWLLFKNIAGDIVDVPPYNVVAKDIVGKCKGLPVTLVEIGKKLKRKEIEQWRDMNRQIDYSEKKEKT